MRDETAAGGGGDLSRLIERALNLGVGGAVVIDPQTVVTAPWVRWKCRYGCGGYGVYRCCPPESPPPQETRAVLACYRRALLLHRVGEEAPNVLLSSLEREAFLSGFYKALALGSGRCRLCDPCTPDRCAHPALARPCLEGWGIDVYATARAHGFPCRVLRDRSETPNRYGLLLID